LTRAITLQFCAVQCALALTVVHAKAVEHLPAADLLTLTRSLVRITSLGCPEGGLRNGTGFAVTTAAGSVGVVTARHVVAGCGGWQAAVVNSDFVAVDPPMALALDKTYGSADLALLSLPQKSRLDSLVPLSVASAAPSVNSHLFTCGFWLGAQGCTEKSYDLVGGPRVLRNQISAVLVNELIKYKSPSPDLAILNLEGTLPPGGSGAPIVNSKLEVVGIATGGLERGAAGVSFAVPSAQLANLFSSTAATPTSDEGKILAGLHAADLQVSRQGTVSCPGFDLTQLRTVTFRDVTKSIDNPSLVARVLALAKLLPNPGDERFDVYADVSTGATFAVPTGSVLSRQGAVCSTWLGSSNVGLFIFERTGLDDPAALSAASGDMQQALLPGQIWSLDTAFGTFKRFDSLGVRTNSFRRLEVAADDLGGGAFRDIAFSRQLLRRSTLSGSTALWLNGFDYLAPTAPCGDPALCAEIDGARADFARAMLAELLTTFSVN